MGDEPGRSGTPEDGLADELRALGRALPSGPVPPELAASVLARVQHDPLPGRSGTARPAAGGGQLRRPGRGPGHGSGRGLGHGLGHRVARRWRITVPVLVGALVAVVVATPASARIAEWLGLGGVVVVQPAAPTPPPGVGPAPGPPPTGEVLSLAQARERVPFTLGVPAALGDPESVVITSDGRVVSMLWDAMEETGGPVRLDQFAGRPDPVIVKTFAGVDFVTVDGAAALWLDRPHPLVYLDAAGVERTESARTSGPALVWQRAAVTLRLEGVADRELAVAVAGSVRG